MFLTAASMKNTAFCDIAPCSLDVSDMFTSSIIRALIALMMEALTNSKTLLWKSNFQY
jgi:hypothetical protein